MFDRILTLCTGNICRSPLAEALLRRQLAAAGRDRAQVRSAGIGALVGAPADQTVRMIARGHGLDLGAHRAQQVDRSLIRWADIILAMEPDHLQFTMQSDPTARGKTFLLGHWLKTPISDPYQQSEERHRATFARIAEAVASWQDRL